MGVLLLDIVKGLNEFIESSVVNYNCEINHFLLWSNNKNLEEDVIYILENFDENNLYFTNIHINLITRNVPKSFLYKTMIPNNINLIVLKPNVDIQHIYDTLQRLFVPIYSDYTDKAILSILCRCRTTSSCKKIIKVAWKILGNPILLLDSSMCLITHINGDIETGEPEWDYIINNGNASIQYFDYLIKQKNVTINNCMQGHKEKESSTWITFLSKHRQLISVIPISMGVVAYIIVLEYSRPFTSDDMRIIDALNSILSMALWIPQERDIQSVLSAKCALLSAILNNKISDKEMIIHRCQALNIAFAHNLYMLCFEKKLGKSSISVLPLIQKILQSHFKCENSILMDDKIAMLYDSNFDAEEIKMQLMKSSRILDTYNLKMGVSTCFTDISQIAEHYRQAQQAIEIGLNNNMDGNIFYYDKLVLYDFLSTFSSMGNIEMFVHPAIQTLKDMSEKGTDYLETMRVYLDCKQNLQLASIKMFIHYNTMKYRIEKIIENTGLNLENNDEILQLMLSFRIMDMKNKNHEI